VVVCALRDARERERQQKQSVFVLSLTNIFKALLAV